MHTFWCAVRKHTKNYRRRIGGCRIALRQAKISGARVKVSRTNQAFHCQVQKDKEWYCKDICQKHEGQHVKGFQMAAETPT